MLNPNLTCECSHPLDQHNITCCGRTNLEQGTICDRAFHPVCLVKVDEKCWCECGCSCTRQSRCACNRFTADNLQYLEQLDKNHG